MMKTDLFKKLATFRVGVLGLEKFEIFHDDENQDNYEDFLSFAFYLL